jgi:hypothetical protein
VIDEYGAMIFAGETEVLGENLPSATLSTTNPTWINPGLHGERPATNRLSHGTALAYSNLLNLTTLVLGNMKKLTTFPAV